MTFPFVCRLSLLNYKKLSDSCESLFVMKLIHEKNGEKCLFFSFIYPYVCLFGAFLR